MGFVRSLHIIMPPCHTAYTFNTISLHSVRRRKDCRFVHASVHMSSDMLGHHQRRSSVLSQRYDVVLQLAEEQERDKEAAAMAAERYR